MPSSNLCYCKTVDLHCELKVNCTWSSRVQCSNDGLVLPITRQKKGEHEAIEEVMKPASIVSYKQHMSGVDHLDQMIAYYPCTRKSLKWSNKVFYYLMEISIHTSFILYKAKNSIGLKSFYKFCKMLVSQLCQQPQEELYSDNDEGPPKKPPKLDPPKRLCGGFNSHHMVMFPSIASKKYPKNACRVCLMGSKRKDTKYYCKECGVLLLENNIQKIN